MAWYYEPVTPKTRMVTNCLNITQGFKRDFKDEEVVLFLSKLDLVDDLIDVHLDNKNSHLKAVFLEWDPVNFKKFFETNPWDKPDPYSSLYLKEHGKWNQTWVMFK